MDPKETDAAIKGLQEDIKRTNSMVETLTNTLDDLVRQFSEVPKAAAPPSSTTLTANGNVPVTINGKRVNLITGS